MKQPLPPLWFLLWVPLLSLSWLLPNHYLPWATFHSDFLVALMLAIVAFSVVACARLDFDWSSFSVAVAILLPIPFLQYGSGLLYFSGQAWVVTAYLIGFLLSILIGAHWEKLTPDRAADALLTAIGLAALISVGLQIRQWLSLVVDADAMQIWANEYSPGRPAANLGQPNQLATLLMWGLVAGGWGVVKKKISPAVFIFFAFWLIFGVALTQSRMAFVAMLGMCIVAWTWKSLWPSRITHRVVCMLFIYFLICTFLLQHLSDVLYLGWDIRPTSMGGHSSDSRMRAYELFVDAALHKPWWGYGWTQLALAQLAVAENHPNLGALFFQSHNLFLDLILWCGIPIGGAFSIYLIFWFVKSVRSIASAEDLILMIFLMIVGLHAMVELPLHHAYFLLPTGLVIGILNKRFNKKIIIKSSRLVIIVILIFSSSLLIVIANDYLKIDANFRTYRLEAARIGDLPAASPPEVLILNDLREFLKIGRSNIHRGMSQTEVEDLRKITMLYPSPFNMFNYAKALALNEKPAEANRWIAKVQKVQPEGYSIDLRRIWEVQANFFPEMALVQWPPLEIDSDAANR